MAWRRTTRATLIERRMAAPPAQRRAWSAAIEPRLEAAIAETRARLVGFYWPFRAEFDPRPLVERLLAAGRHVALPVVVEPKTPMVFRPWSPGCKMTTGVWDIPIPDTEETVLPDLVIHLEDDRALLRYPIQEDAHHDRVERLVQIHSALDMIGLRPSIDYWIEGLSLTDPQKPTVELST